MTFLHEKGLNPEAIDLKALLEAFLREFERGLRGEGALPMIPSGLTLCEEHPTNVSIPAFDVGGTNTRSARVTFDAEGRATFTNLLRGQMPGAQGEVDQATFYAQLCDAIAPNLRAGDRLGFCFSYPITETGELLFWTKKIQAPAIPGRNVLNDLIDALAARGLPNCSGQILNDTVAALLAVYTCPEATDAAGHVGFILGTGTNTAYAEATENIVKRAGLPAGKLMPINCESGNFTDFPKSAFDLRYEAESGNGKAQWERCFSGVHLGSLGTIILHMAAEEGPLSALRDVLCTRTFTHVELNAFCDGTDTTCIPCTAAEAETIRALLLPLYERAACFAAVNIAAAAIASARARKQTRGKILINADGSTFWKTSAIPFAERTRLHLEHLLGHYGYTCEILRVDEAPLLGAALAACCE
jgi:hexokinase